MAESAGTYPFSELSLARRLEGAEGRGSAGIVEARVELQPWHPAVLKKVAGAYAMFDGVESPITQTFGLGVFDPVGEDELQELETFFESRGAAVHHEVSPLAGTELINRLIERGYRAIELTSVMYRPIDPETEIVGSRREGLSVRTVKEGEEALWAGIGARGWAEHGDFSELLLEMARISLARDDAALFLAEREGEAVAAGGLIWGEGVALFAGASTVPEARRQGAQLALLDHRMRYGVERGCDLAMMCAEPGSASQRNAERHGFRIAYTRTKWRRGGGEGRQVPDTTVSGGGA